MSERVINITAIIIVILVIVLCSATGQLLVMELKAEKACVELTGNAQLFFQNGDYYCVDIDNNQIIKAQ